ncbi:MAG: hypothetical protein AAF335_00890 [Bacteroidota bacterium]
MFRRCLYFISFSLCPLSLVNASQPVDLSLTLTDASRTLLVSGYYQHVLERRGSSLPKEIETLISHYIRQDKDPKQWKCLFRLKVEHALMAVQYNPKSMSIAFTAEGGRVGIYNLKTFKIAHKLKHSCETSQLVWDLKGTYVAFGDVENTLRIWYPKEKKLLSKKLNTDGFFSGISCGNNDTLFISCEDHTIPICQVLNGRIDILRYFNPAQGIVSCCECSPDRNYLAVAGRNGSVKIWNIEKPKKPKLLTTIDDGDKKEIYELSWHPNGEELAGSILDGPLIIWKLDLTRKKYKLLKKFENVDFVLCRTQYSPQGSYLVYGGASSNICFYDREEGKKFVFLKNPPLNCRRMSFCPSGNFIAATDVVDLSFSNYNCLLDGSQHENSDSDVGAKEETLKHSIGLYCSPWVPVLTLN